MKQLQAKTQSAWSVRNMAATACRTLIIIIMIWFVKSDCESTPLKTYKTMKEYVANEKTETAAQQVLMINQEEAVCLDGSVADFYYRAGFSDGVNKFHIYLEGGGWCIGLDYCAQRATTTLGSSKYDGQYANIAAGAPYLSSNQSINPLSYNWNSIFVRYCDGFMYASNNNTIYKYNSSITLHFKGWRILNGVLNVLKNQYNLSNATDVLFSGCSAGALANFFHADYIYETILEFKHNKEPFNYMVMPDAGYFMQTNFQIPGIQWNWQWGNVSIGMNQNCLEYYKDGSQCMWAFNVSPFIKSKMFALQSQYDANQVAGFPNNYTAVNQYGQNLTYWYIDKYINTSSKHYGWLVSCFQHCNFGTNTWNDILIDNYTVSQAQVNVWFNKVTGSNLLFQNNTYPCTTCC